MMLYIIKSIECFRAILTRIFGSISMYKLLFRSYILFIRSCGLISSVSHAIMIFSAILFAKIHVQVARDFELNIKIKTFLMTKIPKI